MNKMIPLALLSFSLASASHASFFVNLLNAAKDTAKRTSEALIIEKTNKIVSELIRDMFIGYTSVQTKSNEEVTEEYSKENGSVPESTKVSAYRTQIYPSAAVSPGTEVKVKSYIEVVQGRTSTMAVLEERLTIWDNEDNSIALKSMTKEAGEKGGGFVGEFSFTLPEGLPQGVYPISSDLMLNGELVGDQKHQLQLVIWQDGEHSMRWQLAALPSLAQTELK